MDIWKKKCSFQIQIPWKQPDPHGKIDLLVHVLITDEVPALKEEIRQNKICLTKGIWKYVIVLKTIFLLTKMVKLLKVADYKIAFTGDKPHVDIMSNILQHYATGWRVICSVSSKSLWRDFHTVTCQFDALQHGWIGNLKRGFFTLFIRK